MPAAISDLYWWGSLVLQVKGKKKKSKKELEVLEEKEKKDKKGFFFRKKKSKAQVGVIYGLERIILMALRTTAVTPLLTQQSYHYLGLSINI